MPEIVEELIIERGEAIHPKTDEPSPCYTQTIIFNAESEVRQDESTNDE